MIEFKTVTSAYLRPDAPENPQDRTHEDLQMVFEGLSITIPSGLVSVLGPNGAGKSTFLLLAGARIFPLAGSITIDGIDASTFLNALNDPIVEENRNKLVSFVYQNMEFETDQTFAELLDVVSSSVETSELRQTWFARAQQALELEPCLTKRPQEMSKGELQRAIIMLALLYGSPIVIMDEPVFAMEDHHKLAVFGFLRDYCQAMGTTIIYSAHDIEICREFATHSILFWRENDQAVFLQGEPATVCSKAPLEKAYQTPLAMLHHKETLYREMLRANVL